MRGKDRPEAKIGRREGREQRDQEGEREWRCEAGKQRRESGMRRDKGEGKGGRKAPESSPFRMCGSGRRCRPFSRRLRTRPTAPIHLGSRQARGLRIAAMSTTRACTCQEAFGEVVVGARDARRGMGWRENWKAG